MIETLARQGKSIMKYTIRLLKKSDESILWDMFYYAIYVREGEKALPRDIVNLPELSHYVENWGKEGDFGFLAIDEQNTPVGSVWLRQFSEGNEGFGFIDNATPELSIAVIPTYRGRGIGTALMNNIIESYSSKSRISLSVTDVNPARRLYKRFGFNEVSQTGNSITMILDGKDK